MKKHLCHLLAPLTKTPMMTCLTMKRQLIPTGNGFFLQKVQVHPKMHLARHMKMHLVRHILHQDLKLHHSNANMDIHYLLHLARQDHQDTGQDQGHLGHGLNQVHSALHPQGGVLQVFFQRDPGVHRDVEHVPGLDHGSSHLDSSEIQDFHNLTQDSQRHQKANVAHRLRVQEKTIPWMSPHVSEALPAQTWKHPKDPGHREGAQAHQREVKNQKYLMF
uniref:Middle T antigen n=1 Tax=Carp adomavirus TaxID=2609874 RepID=A0A6F9EYL3_9VIRU|nr:TPA_asm: middle T antigen [Carp adomavirus]